MNGEDFKRLEQIVVNFKDEVKDEFRHQIGIQSEHFQHKLDIVVEGHQMLSEKLDRWKTDLEKKIECVEYKLDAVSAKVDTTATKLDAVDAKLTQKIDAVDAKLTQKLDAVAADLTAHRQDTEAHPTIYKVKEGI